MLGETEPVARALDNYEPTEEEDSEAVINIAYHQGANPKKGFDLILQQYGICSAITTLGSGESPFGEDVREHCIKQVTSALYEELRERLIADIEREEKQAPSADTPVKDLIQGRFYLFGEDFYHIDISHLAAVVQMSIHLPPDCAEFALAREMCGYGEKLNLRERYLSEPPFEDQYADYAIYLAVLADDNRDSGLEHFRNKINGYDPDEIGTFPIEVFINLLLRVDREEEAVQIASKHLVDVDERQLTCPGIIELCERTKSFAKLAELAEAARQRGTLSCWSHRGTAMFGLIWEFEIACGFARIELRSRKRQVLWRNFLWSVFGLTLRFCVA